MLDNNLTLKSISNLERMKFFIPCYQRGYRWDKQQVLDLLEDIDSFSPECTEIPSEQTWYCLQPLVVKSRNTNILKSIKEAEDIDEVKALLQGDWEVIDGQQRLTTIYILLSYLGWDGMFPYSMEYETRKGSKSFLENICKDNDDVHKEQNIDYFHIIEAWKTITDWFEDSQNPERTSQEFKNQYRNKVLFHVKFIWYESNENDPIEVFKNLNSGKIALTNAELIKALFLNKSNFKVQDCTVIKQKQIEIAAEWDTIEYTLQDEEFWLFLHNIGREYRDTRIESLFDIALERNLLELRIDAYKYLRTDRFKTFDYFYKYFLQCGENIDILETWAKIKSIFDTFQEWFTDLRLYHYVGYLVAEKTKITDILEKWEKAKDKEDFVEKLIKDKNGICSKIRNCNNLDKVYEISVPDDSTSGNAKTTCKPLLLLFNIQTVIEQYSKEGERYGMGMFYRFPFHLYKIERWDVEHIDSNTENDLSDEKARTEYLINIYNGVNKTSQNKILNYFNSGKHSWDDVMDLVAEPKNSLDDGIEKNQIWNFTLLDSSTNRSYGNSIFSAKRRIIIGKDKGEYIPIPKSKEVGGKTVFEVEAENTKANSSFIPPCTKHVFLKYYSAFTSEPNYWDKDDARAYKIAIFKTLRRFGVIMDETK